MAASSEPPSKKGENTYIIDAESAAEMARLMRQDQLVTAGMGGIFPENIDLSGIQRVIDLACGPGGWPLEVAYTYSDMDVIGVDISERMIKYASAQAMVQQRKNLQFRVMDILKPLDFPDASFDLVNARLISGFMLRAKWPQLFQECLRILRPGGILRLTEVEPGITNKFHHEKALQLGMQAMSRAGINFSPSGTRYGVVQMLPAWYREAGFSILGTRAHYIEYSFGTPAHDGFYHDLATALQLFERVVVATKIASVEEWHNLSQKALAEMHNEDFRAAWFLLTVWGSKAD